MRMVKLSPAQHYAVKTLQRAEGSWGWIGGRPFGHDAHPVVAWSTATVLADLGLVTQGNRKGNAYLQLTERGRKLDRWHVPDPR